MTILARIAHRILNAAHNLIMPDLNTQDTEAR